MHGMLGGGVGFPADEDQSHRKSHGVSGFLVLVRRRSHGSGDSAAWGRMGFLMVRFVEELVCCRR